MAAFIQKVLPEAMANHRLHLALIKSYMLDTRFAAKYPIDSELRTIKDMNYVKAPGLYRLTKDTRNYCNPEDKSNQYWYEPTKDTTGIPSRSVAFAYIIPLTNEYTRQYVLLGAEGHIDIKTRLGHITNEKTEWGKWREYADRNPSYEMLKDTSGKEDTNYISFGNFELSLPDARECNLGTVIRLDQWKGKGRVYSVEGTKDPSTGKINYHEKDTVDTEPALMTYGSDYTLSGVINTVLSRDNMFSWSDGTYRLDTLLVYDKFYWSILKNDVELYRSEQSVFDAPDPGSTRYHEIINGVPTEDYANLTMTETKSVTDEDMIETCNTYEFEVFNDHEPYNSYYNYWVLFQYNTANDAIAKMTAFYNQSLHNLKQDIIDIHTRVTSEVYILNSTINYVSAQITDRINLVSNQLSKYVDDSIWVHNYDTEAHPYILSLIAAGGGEAAKELARHIVDPDAHANIIGPIVTNIENIQGDIVNINNNMFDMNVRLNGRITQVSGDLSHYVDITSADISRYIASLSWNIYNSMYSCCNYMTSLIYTVSGDLSDYTALVSHDLSQYVDLVSNQLVTYVDVTSKDIKDYIDSLSWSIDHLDVGITSLVGMSGIMTSLSEDGHTGYIIGLPAGDTSYGMVVAYPEVVEITGPVESITVPTVNAVVGICSKIYTQIYTVSGDLSNYATQISADLVTYVDVTSQKIKDYIDTLSWEVDHMDAGVMYISVYSGLYLNSSPDGHYVEISGLPATYDAYGMVYVTSEVISLGPDVESRHYVVPDTNAVYDQLKSISGLVATVSRDVSNDLYDTSWSIADYIYHMSSAIIDYIDVVDSGVIEISGFSGIYTELTANGRSAFISGLPAGATSYGMVYAITSLGWMDATDITKDYTVPTVNAVMDLYGLISNQIYQVSGDLSSYVDITSYHITNYLENCCSTVKAMIGQVSTDLSAYVDVTSKDIKDYIDTLSWSIEHLDVGVTSIIGLSGIMTSATDNGHVYHVIGLPASETSYGMVYTYNTIEPVLGCTSDYTVPTVNAIVDLYGTISTQIYTVSGELSDYTALVSNQLSTYVDVTSKEIKDYIDSLSWHIDHLDVGITSAIGVYGIYTSMSEDGHTVYIAGLPATATSYGMVYTLNHLETIYDETSEYTVPTVNAVSYAITTLSAEISEYITIVSGDISGYVAFVSNSISDHIVEVSGGLEAYTSRVSGELSEYIDEKIKSINPGVVSVYVDSGLYGITTDYGHAVSIIGLPANETSYGMVYTLDHLETIYGETSGYTVPTVNAVSNAITVVSSLIAEVSWGLSAYISTTSWMLSHSIYETSGQLSSFVRNVSQEIIDYIDGLPKVDPGIISVYAYSGLYGTTTPDGRIVEVSGIPATYDEYGMVKTIDYLTLIHDPSSSFVVPTVNAVSKAITDAIYTQLPPEIYNITSNIYIEIGSQYIPWDAVMDTKRIHPNANTFGANFYTSAGRLYVYNDYTDGTGWQGVGETNPVINNFGTVITWDKVSKIEETIHTQVKVDPFGNDVIDIDGNPGYMFVVPTVNAVYDALMELSAKIPTITSKVINIVSEMYVENHLHNYITVNSHISNIFVTSITEVHYDQMVSIVTHSGLTHRYDDGVYHLSGSPATLDEYGMVVAYPEITEITGPAVTFTVPTVNAVSYYGAKISSIVTEVSHDLSAYVDVTSKEIIDYINSLPVVDPGVVSVYVNSGLYGWTNDYGHMVSIIGLPASYTSYGMVYTQDDLKVVLNETSSYTVPTVNAVSYAITTLSAEISNYITIVSGEISNTIFEVSGGLEDFTSRVSGELSTFVRVTSKEIIDYIDGLPKVDPGVVSVYVDSGLYGITTNYGHFVSIIGLPASYTSYGMVYTHDAIETIAGETSEYTVPTVNAVSWAITTLSAEVSNYVTIVSGDISAYVALVSNNISAHIVEVSGGLEEFTSKVSGELSEYIDEKIKGLNTGVVSVYVDSGLYGWTYDFGHMVSIIGLPASYTSYGMVYTQDTLNVVLDNTSSYTVPTVNAVSWAITTLSAEISEYVTIVSGDISEYIALVSNQISTRIEEVSGGLEDYTSRVSGELSNYIDEKIRGIDVGVVSVFVNSGLYGYTTSYGHYVSIIGLPASYTSYGMVYTHDVIETIYGETSEYTVPTVNAVSYAIATLSAEVSEYVTIVSGDISGYIAYVSNSISAHIVEVSGGLEEYTSKVSGELSTYIDEQIRKINPGVISVYVDSGLYGITTDYGHLVSIVGIPASYTSYGMVYTQDDLAPVFGETSEYTVPTVNAVSIAITTLSAEVSEYVTIISGDISEYIAYVSNRISTHIIEVSSGLEDYTSRVSGELSTYIDEQLRKIDPGVVSVYVNSGLYGITTNYGHVVSIVGLPATYTSYGMVYTQDNLTVVLNETSEYTVPTVNAVSYAITTLSAEISNYITVVSGAISNTIFEVSGGLEAFTSRVSGELSTFVKATSKEIIDYIDGLPKVDPGIISVYLGSGLSGYMTSNGHYIYISGLSATDTSYGMVYVVSSIISLVNDDYRRYTAEPDVNAVYEYGRYLSSLITEVSNTFGTYTSAIYGVEPIYVSKQGNDYQVELAIDSTFNGGVHISTVTMEDGSTYLMADAQHPDAGDEVGTVKTIDYMTLINDGTQDYTVPTVNAVSKAITDAIYTTLPPEIYNITSTIYVEIGSQYIPWDAVMDVRRISPMANTFGANFYTSTGRLYVYNDYALGDGWRELDDQIKVLPNFGTVITWNQVSRVDEYVATQLPIDPNDPNGHKIDIQGNPGDMFVVPTVNAVYDALMELSAKIPTITSKVINIVSEMYVENHLHNYITVVSHVSYINVTSITEVHYDQMVSIVTHSGLTHRYEDDTYHLSGLPATLNEYGMVIAYPEIIEITGPAVTFTVPTVNAVSGFGSEISSSLSAFVRTTSKEIIDYIDSLPQVDPGVMSVYVDSGLYGITTDYGHLVSIIGLPATRTSYGMVYTHDDLVAVLDEMSSYTVPTVNAVSWAIATLSAEVSEYVTVVSGNISEYIGLVSNQISAHIVEVSGGLEDYTSRVSGELSNYIDEKIRGINAGVVSVFVDSGLYGVTTDYGHVVSIIGLPASYTSYGMVYTQNNLDPVYGETSEYTVPTVNTVSWAIATLSAEVSEYVTIISGDISGYIAFVSNSISAHIVEVSGGLEEYTSKVSGELSNYIDEQVRKINPGVISVYVDSGLYGITTDYGHFVSIVGLPANYTSYGMVYTQDNLAIVLNETSSYTVPTVNAVSLAIATLSAEVSDYVTVISGSISEYIGVVSSNISAHIVEVSGGLEDYTSRVSGELSNYIDEKIRGINVGIVSVVVDSGLYGVMADYGHLVSIVGLPASYTSYGMVYTQNNLIPVFGEASEYTVPTVNAVSLAITTLSAEVSEYVTIVSGSISDYITYVSNSISAHIVEVSGGLEDYTSRISGELSNYIDEKIKGINTGVVSVVVNSGLYGITTDYGHLVSIVGLPASYTSYGMVYTHDVIETIFGDTSTYTVPTVNAVSFAIATLSAEVSEYITIVSGDISGYIAFVSRSISDQIVKVSGGLEDYTSRVSGELSNYIDERIKSIDPGVVSVYVNSGLYGITTNYGHLVSIVGLPAAYTSYGMVYTQNNITPVFGETSEYTVPTVNAVSSAIAVISNIFGEYTSAIYSVAPIYTSRKGNDYQVNLAYDTNYFGGVRVSTITHDDSTYLMADAQQPNEADKLGTVKTVGYITLINDPSSAYVVPTVNAVSRAITDAIYTTLPPEIHNITSLIYVEIGSQYVPWDAIMDIRRINPMANTFGANFYTSTGRLYVYNDYALGDGWRELDDVIKTVPNFGTVITWDRVSRIEEYVNVDLPIDPHDPNGHVINVQGNPGDMFVVPTVNAVYDALMELSAKIPTITSKNIYIVSEVYTENHLHNYITVVSHISYVNVTSITEVHYDQMVSINGFSGIKATLEAPGSYSISGLPGTTDSYGMAFIMDELAILTGPAAIHTVPTVNAVSRAFGNLPAPTTINTNEPLYKEVNENEVTIGLRYTHDMSNGVRLNGTVEDDKITLRAEAQTADTLDAIGTVKTINDIAYITDTSSVFVVPTVNAVSVALANISNIFGTYTSRVFGVAPVYVSRSGNDYQVEMAIDSVLHGGIGVSTITMDGSTYLAAWAQQPDAGAKIGTVKTRDTLTKVTDDTSNYTVPTVNAVIEAIKGAVPNILTDEPIYKTVGEDNVTIGLHHTYEMTNGVRLTGKIDGDKISLAAEAQVANGMDEIGTVKTIENITHINGTSSYFVVPTVNAVSVALANISNIFGTYTSRLFGVAPVYTSRHGNDYEVKVAIDSTIHGGVMVSTVTLDGSTYLTAYVQQPDAINKLGTVKTKDTLTKVTDETSNYTVPTVNAVIEAINDAVPNINTVEPLYSEVGEDNVTIGLHYTYDMSNGVRLNGTIDGTKIILRAEAQTADTYDAIGTVKTTNEITYITSPSNVFAVPTVNAVSKALANISNIFGTYTSRVHGVPPVYTTRTGNDYDVKLAINSDWYGGVHVSTVTMADTSTYIVVEAQQPNEADALGTVKTVGNIIWVYDPSSAYVVPTVNAVSRAITDAIYAMPIATENNYGGVRIGDITNIINAGIVSAIAYTSFVGINSNYVPWDAIHDYDHYDPAQYDLGANIYIYKPDQTEDKSQWELYVYNEYADGAGWDGGVGRRTTDNFGTVITWDKVSRIDTVVNITMPVVPWDDREDAPAAMFQGNPGDAFVVPTVNAVYDALMELSAKIPTITSKVIYIVSEVYTENHLHNYVTVVSHISYVTVNSTTEIHLDQIVSINTYSGLTHEVVDVGKINISGLPATNTDYGMVFVTDVIAPIPGVVGTHTVPTMNALYTTDSTLQSHLNNHPQGKIYDAVDPIYIDEFDNINLGAVYGAFAGVELGINEDGDLYAMGLPATDGVVGVVSTVTTVVSMGDNVPAAVKRFHVPTVNAVYDAIAAVSTTIVGKPPIYTSRNGKTQQVELAIDSTLYGGVKVSTITTNDSTYLIAGAQQPDAAALVGTVKTQANLNLVGNDSGNYTVPTVNAVSKAVFEAIYTQLPGDIIHHETIVDCGSNYVPWDSIRDVDYTHEATNIDNVHTFGANFYVLNSDGKPAGLYVFNELPDGAGWPQGANPLTGYDPFGTVVTWNKVSRIELNYEDYDVTIDKDADKAVALNGNPGDKWVVPTVNAVYDALMELSAKIPTVVSKEIHTVSIHDVNYDNRQYHYITVDSSIHYHSCTSITEVHYDQLISINAYSGLYATKPKVDTYNISGLPANTVSYGMVLMKTEIEQTAGDVGAYTVPDINAIWRLSSRVNSHINNHPGGDDDPDYMFGGDINGGTWIRTTEIGQYTRVEAIGDIAYKSAYNNTPKIMRGPVYVTDQLDYYGDLSYDTATLIKTHNDSHYATVPNVRLVSTLANVLYGVSSYVAGIGPGGGIPILEGISGGIYVSKNNDANVYQITGVPARFDWNGLAEEAWWELGVVETHDVISTIPVNETKYGQLHYRFAVPTLNAMARVSGELANISKIVANHPGYVNLYTDQPAIHGVALRRIYNFDTGETSVVASAALAEQYGAGTVFTKSKIAGRIDSSINDRITGDASDYTVPTINAVIDYVHPAYTDVGAPYQHHMGVVEVYNTKPPAMIPSDQYSSGTYPSAGFAAAGINLLCEISQQFTNHFGLPISTIAPIKETLAMVDNVVVSRQFGLSRVLTGANANGAHLAQATNGDSSGAIYAYNDMAGVHSLNGIVDQGMGVVYAQQTIASIGNTGWGAHAVPTVQTVRDAMLDPENYIAPAFKNTTNGSLYLGVVKVHDTVTSYAANSKETIGDSKIQYYNYMFHVPNINLMFDVSTTLSYHIAHHPGGGGGYDGVQLPLWVDGDTLKISGATTEAPGTVMSTNQVLQGDNTHVPTANAVYQAILEYGGGGGGKVRYPNYGSATGIGAPGGTPVASGTAGSDGCWVLVSITFADTATGCVGIAIGGGYVPIAIFRGGSITQMFPIPPGISWTVYNNAGTGASIICRTL